MFAISYALIPYLPQELIVHWNFQGVADNTAPALQALAIIPFVTAISVIVFHFLPLMDPKKKRYEEFADVYEKIQYIFMAFFTYLQFIIIYTGIEPKTNALALIFAGIGVLFILMGNYLGKIRQNYFVGIRTPWTIDNERVWNKSNRFAGVCFVVTGMIIILHSLIFPTQLAYIMFFVLSSALAPVLYSFLIFKK